MPQLIRIGLAARGHSRVAGIKDACGRVRVNGAVRALEKTALAEIETLAVDPGERQERIPSQSAVYGKPRTDLPGVLRVCPEVIAAEADILNALLGEGI